MIDKRMMYAYGQLVKNRPDGKRPGYRGSSYGSPSRSSSQGPAGGASSGGNYGGNSNNSSSSSSSSSSSNDSRDSYRMSPSFNTRTTPTPKTTTPTRTGPQDLGLSSRTDYNPTPVDRSAVSQFSTYGRNTMNQNLKGPTLGQRIGNGISNIGNMAGNYIKSGGIFGMGARGLDSLLGKIFGPSIPSTGNINDEFGIDGNVYAGTNVNTRSGNEGSINYNNINNNDEGNQGIMAAYNPYILPVEEEVSEEDLEEDFIQRFRGFNRTRQDKQGQLDPAILEMISKLYK